MVFQLSIKRARPALRGTCMGVLSVLLLTATGAMAAPAQDSALARFQSFMNNVHSLKAHFTQTVTGGALGGHKKSRGTVIIKRPNRFRWHYQSPHKQIIDADGQNLWLYDVGLDQVTVKPLETTLASSPAMVLSGKGTLTDAFRITNSSVDNDVARITLAPRADNSAFKTIQISIGTKGLQSMRLTSANLGKITTIHFSDVVRNATLKKDAFKFTPPKGTDVIHAAH